MAKNTIPAGENKMGVMPIGKLVISMSAPMMASMIFQALYNIVDSVFVSRVSQDALNAVSLAFPFQTLMMAFALGTGVGMNSLISRSLGQKDQNKADQTAGTGIFLFILSAIAFCVLSLFLAEPYYRFQTQNENIIRFGKQYILVCGGWCFGLFGQICEERLLQSTGRTQLSMISQICGAICNIILDPILIFGLFGFPRLEVMGAAVATVVGQTLACVVGFVLNIRKNAEIHLSLKRIRPNAPIIKEIYRIGIPSIVMQCVGSVMNFVLDNLLIAFTEAATAVFGAYYKIQSIIFMPVFGMNSAMVPIISYNYGACKPERVKQTTRICILIAVGIMTVGTLLFELIPGPLLSLFNPSEEMLSVGKVAFRIIAIHFPVAGFCIVVGSVCQAMGKPVYTLITSICRQLVVLLPVAWLLSLTGVLDSVWWAFPIAEVISGLINIYFLKATLRRVDELESLKNIQEAKA